MKLLIAFILSITICSILHADDIYLKNGKRFINVTVTDSTDEYYVVKFTTKTITRIPKEDVLRIFYKALNGQSFFDESRYIDPKKITLNEANTKIEYPNAFLIPIAIASMAIGYDYLKESSDIQNSIDLAKKLSKNANTSDLESKKTRKTLIGVTCIAAGVVTGILSLRTIEVSATPSTLQISYKYNF